MLVVTSLSHSRHMVQLQILPVSTQNQLQQVPRQPTHGSDTDIKLALATLRSFQAF